MSDLKITDQSLRESLAKIAAQVESGVGLFPGLSDENFGKLTNDLLDEILDEFGAEDGVNQLTMEDLMFILVTGIYVGKLLGETYE